MLRVAIAVLLSALTLQVNGPQAGSVAPGLVFDSVLVPTGARSITIPSESRRVTVLDFFATWCAPCVASLDHMRRVEQLTETLPVQFVTVVQESSTALEPLIAGGRLGGIVAYDTDGRAFARYRVRALPLVVVVANGRVLFSGSAEAITPLMLQAAVRQSN
jgi:thiol-disulfide isomerase/thioredoxin